MARFDAFRRRLTNEYGQPTALVLTFTNSTWRVQSGCPYLSGSYTLSAGDFQHLDPESSSGSSCPAGDYEDGNIANVGNLIHQATHVTISGGELYLHAKNWRIILQATK